MAISKIPFPPFASSGDQECKDVDPEIFYPPTYRATSVAPAVRVCNRCPLQTECALWAVTVGEPEGVWGGLTPDQRRRVRAEMKA